MSTFSEIRVIITFCHNWGIYLALIGRELFDKSDDHACKLRDGGAIFRENSKEIREMDVKTVDVILKSKSTTIVNGLYSYRLNK